jgi:hypothetical protein
MELWRHKEKFPPEIEQYFYSKWDNHDLWNLVAPCERLQVHELEWHLNYPFWSTSPPESVFDLRPGFVLENPNKYPKHRERIESADLEYPILVGRFGGRHVILDGFHRLLKAIKNGATFMECKNVPQSHIRVAA